MPKPTTAEQVLKAIYEAHADAFADARRLSALFSDYSGGQLKAQQNQLDIFLKCEGNTCILNLRNAPKQKQQTEYHRLTQEMVNGYGMQKEAALKVSGAFWRVTIGTEPPVPAGESVPAKACVTFDLPKKTVDSVMTAEEMFRRGKSYCYAPGMPARQWWPKAMQWFEKAAEQNHLEAQKTLGGWYSVRRFQDEGIFANPVKSAYWYCRAAEQGDAASQLQLGRYYRDGFGVEQDYDQAVYWCRKAAEGNCLWAMDDLSRCYREGIGTAKDPVQADYWQRKAGHPPKAAPPSGNVVPPRK